MAEQENSKDLISVLWSGADVLRSKMDANEYKNYLLGIVFYKYLSDSFLIRVYDLINDEKPESLKVALEAYKNELKGEYANDLLDELKQDRKYVIEPELHIHVLQRMQGIIALIVSNYRKHSIILSRAESCLWICFPTLICIQAGLERETRNKVIQLQN